MALTDNGDVFASFQADGLNPIIRSVQNQRLAEFRIGEAQLISSRGIEIGDEGLGKGINLWNS
jgi:hypothetical protein